MSAPILEGKVYLTHPYPTKEIRYYKRMKLELFIYAALVLIAEWVSIFEGSRVFVVLFAIAGVWILNQVEINSSKLSQTTYLVSQ